jgi:hypothetical protein
MSEEAIKNEKNEVKATENVQKVLAGEITKGTLKLSTPIRAKSQDVTELQYDFSKLTGWEYVEAMDADVTARNVFKISNKQALCLFAAAAGKATPDVDATDIKERIGAVDALRAVQLATVFLITSTRAANQNT